MRELQSIELSEVIVHILDTRKELEVSELPIPSDSDRQIFDYFKKRIQGSLEDDRARAAKFRQETAEPATICQTLLEGGDLTEGSQQLAQRLYGIMQQDSRISAGDLAVCRFYAKEAGERRPFLAIVKIDPTAALRQRRKHDQQGRLFITFDVVQQMLPSAGEQLQKGAFVRELAPRRDYDMLLVDRQVRPAVGPRVSQFFSQSFLDAAEALSSAEATRQFVRETKVLRRLFERQLPPQESDRFDTAVSGAVGSQKVELDHWVSNLELSERAKKKVKAKLGPKHFPDRTVEIVEEVVRAETARKRVFRGDHGLRLEIPPDFPPDQYSDETKQQPGKFGGRQYHVVTLETEDWKERP